MNRDYQTHGCGCQSRVAARKLAFTILLVAQCLSLLGCANLRLPAIDPTGNRCFLPRPYSTTFARPERVNPLRGTPPPVTYFPPSQQVPPLVVVPPPQLAVQTPGPAFPTPTSAPLVARNQIPLGPAFKQAADPPKCGQPFVKQCGKKHIIPYPKEPRSAAARGQIISTPHRIVAPVGSEVVVLTGICGTDGRFALNQPLEWMLSNDSVGQFIEVGGTAEHKAFNELVSPTAKKIDGQYAWGRTGLKKRLLTRGTPTPLDDITLLKGQSFISVASASPGTSYVTSVAPKAAGWDKRRTTTLIHWVDGNWSIPLPTSATAGSVHAMTTKVTSATGDGGVPDWKVRYAIVGGAPAEFAPTGSQTAETETGRDGLATVQIRQPAGQFDSGTTQIRVDVVRPRQYGETELVVESSITTVTWSAPQLTIRVNGPNVVDVNRPFNYRIQVTNPGDQVVRGVTVSTKDLNQNTDFISSAPKPTEYGQTYEWQLGDIAPGGQPKIIDVQLKSGKPGNVSLCFDVASRSDGLQTQACAQTEIAALCIGLEIQGPTVAKLGQEVDFNLIIVNQCKESLHNLELIVKYDQGLVAPNLGNPIRYKIDSLGFGQTENVPLKFQVTGVGRKCFELSIAADNGNSAKSRTCITVTPAGVGPGTGLPGGGIQPNALGVVVSGQQRIEDGSSTLIRTVVRNNSNQPINDIILTQRFSPSLNPIEVTDSFRQGWLNDDLAFNIGTLNPGAEAVIEVKLEATQADANAFTEITLSTPAGSASSTQRLNIQIEPAGSLGNQPGQGTITPLEPPITIPEQGRMIPKLPSSPLNPSRTGPALPAASKPASGHAVAYRGGRIPVPPVNPGRGDLQIDVAVVNKKTIDVGSEVNIQFSIRNARNSTADSIDITMLIPANLRLMEYDDSRWGLAFKTPISDPSRISFEPRNQMRPGEVITFIARVKALRSGPATFEMQATHKNTDGVFSGSATVFVR